MEQQIQSTFDEEFKLTEQKKFLSLLIYDSQWALLNGLEVIRPEYFDSNYLKNICKWIKQYAKKYKNIPTRLILQQKAQTLINDNQLSPKEYYKYQEILDEIFTLERSDELEYYKTKAIDFARTATWKAALLEAGNALKIHNYEEALNKFKEVLNLGAERDLGTDFQEQTPEEFLKLLHEKFDKSNMIQTGIEGWDKALGGGFARNNIHIIAACPGGGKSRIMAFLTKQALMAGKKVILVSLELDENETMANINSSVTGFTMYDLLKEENREEFIKKETAFKNTFAANLHVKFYQPKTINTDTIHNYIRMVMQEEKERLNGIEWKPDLIVIDYMDNLLPIQKIRGSMYEDAGAVATDLKNLAISFDCPVITGSQLGKYSWNVTGNDVISMDSIAESAAKVHLAHSMTTVNVNSGEKALGRARLFLAKSRSGNANSIVWVENDLGRCCLREIAEWNPKDVEDEFGTFKVKSNTSRK